MEVATLVKVHIYERWELEYLDKVHAFYVLRDYMQGYMLTIYQKACGASSVK